MVNQELTTRAQPQSALVREGSPLLKSHRNVTPMSLHWGTPVRLDLSFLPPLVDSGPGHLVNTWNLHSPIGGCGCSRLSSYLCEPSGHLAIPATACLRAPLRSGPERTLTPLRPAGARGITHTGIRVRP